MTFAIGNELVEAYEREVQELVSTERKYRTVLGGSEVNTVVRAFRFTFEHGVDKVTAQMLYDMIDDVSGE